VGQHGSPVHKIGVTKTGPYNVEKKHRSRILSLLARQQQTNKTKEPQEGRVNKEKRRESDIQGTSEKKTMRGAMPRPPPGPKVRKCACTTRKLKYAL